MQISTILTRQLRFKVVVGGEDDDASPNMLSAIVQHQVFFNWQSYIYYNILFNDFSI